MSKSVSQFDLVYYLKLNSVYSWWWRVFVSIFVLTREGRTGGTSIRCDGSNKINIQTDISPVTTIPAPSSHTHLFLPGRQCNNVERFDLDLIRCTVPNTNFYKDFCQTSWILSLFYKKSDSLCKAACRATGLYRLVILA